MPIILLNQAERLPLQFEETTIFYHRLTYSEREEVATLANQRGQLNLNAWHLEVSKRAVNGWEGLYGADLQAIPVPMGPTPQAQQERIGAIVEYFPSGVLQAIAAAAYADTAEELKKSWETMYGAGSSSRTAAPGTNSPASTAASNGETTALPSPATPEG